MGPFPEAPLDQCISTLETVFPIENPLGVLGEPSCGPVVTFALIGGP